MFIRFITLVCVAILSGAAGTAAGILIAPAKGEETRQKVSVFVEDHGHVVVETIQKGRQLLGNAVEFVTSQRSQSEDAS